MIDHDDETLAKRAEFDEATAFLNAHGYPMGVDLAWIEQMLHYSEQRLVKLSAMGAPVVILEGERRIIAKRKAWIEAWHKEHP